MSKVIPVSPAIEAALALPVNTHGFKIHCLEMMDNTTLDGRTVPNRWFISTNGHEAFLSTPDDYTVHYFLTGKSAAAAMADLKYTHPNYSFRISRYNMPQGLADVMASSMIWESREALRLKDGTYQPLPWSNEPWFSQRHETLKHFAHISDKAGLIAFTESGDKGAADLQKRMSPGRYLEKYYSNALVDLGTYNTGATNIHGNAVYRSALEHYCFIFSSQFGDSSTLHFATTPDEIARVYEDGPQSCMKAAGSDNPSKFDDLPCHPCSIYGAGDLHLAYLQEADGDIVARALVWPDKKVTGRAYGDVSSLLIKLQVAGYDILQDNWNCLRGARLLKIPYEGGYIMPYIDSQTGGHYYGVHEDGKHFAIGGSRSACYQTGLDHEEDIDNEDDERPLCTHCDEPTDEGSLVFVQSNRRSEEYWCDGCREHHSFTCSHDGVSYADSVPSTCVTRIGEVANHNLSDGDYFQCAVSGEWYHNDERAGTYHDDDEFVSGEAVSDSNLVQDVNGHYWFPIDLERYNSINEVAA